MKTSTPAACLLVLLLGSAGLLYAGPAHESGRETVASVNGVGIPRSYLLREIQRFEEQLRRQGRLLDEEDQRLLADQALDTLINMEILYQESRRRGIAVSEARVAGEVQALRERFADPKDFEAALQQMGFAPGELEQELLRQLAVQELIDRDIAPTVAVPDTERREYYEEHPEVFRVPGQVRARHILIRVPAGADAEAALEARERIDGIRRRIVAGEDFGELARTLSEDPSSAQGGDLGFFSRDEMVSDFAEAAFALPVGRLSEAVRTDFGYHLIEVIARNEEAVLPYAEIESRLGDYLRHEKTMIVLEGLAARLRETAAIEEFPAGQGAE